jgi:hypothetical protein
VKYVEDLELQAKEDTESVTETERCYGKEMNVEKTKVMGISSQPSPVQIMIDQKQPENVEFPTMWVV